MSKRSWKLHTVYNGLLQLRCDPYGSEGRDAVLSWFDEEQGVLLEVAEMFVPAALERSGGTLCLDPGCGSAVLSLGIAKKFQPIVRNKINKIYAIDVNEKAVTYAKDNARLNHINDLYEFVHGAYTHNIVPERSAAIISHNVPYHPTPPCYMNTIPTFAGGGEDGQALLRPFLEASSHHLADHGVLYGTVNCRGNDLPEFFDYIRIYFRDDSIYWYPIHDPCSTYGFLEYVTRWQESMWAESIARKYPKNHVGVYVVIRDGKGGSIKIIHQRLRNATPDWQLRWDAHRTVQDMAVQSLAEQ